MKDLQLLSKFFRAIENSPFIGPSHVSFYVALLEIWNIDGFEESVVVKRAEVMLLARIKSISTYHRLLKDLVSSGCIRYEPSFGRNGGRFFLQDISL